MMNVANTRENSARIENLDEQGELCPETARIRMYRVFDTNLLVLSEVPVLGDHIQHFSQSLEIAPGPADARLAIFPCGTGPRNQVILCSPELGMAKFCHLGKEAWVSFRHVFLRLVLRYSQAHYMLHAAAIADEKGRAALIVGVSNAGKTSILLGLLREGYRMVTDDYCVLRNDTLQVTSLPTGITVTERTLKAFPELAVQALSYNSFVCERQLQWTVHPSMVYSECPPYSELSPTHVFFVFPDFGKESRIEPCSEETAQYWLNEGRFHPSEFIREFGDPTFELQALRLKTMRTLLRTARFFCVTNGDLERTVSIIAENFHP